MMRIKFFSIEEGKTVATNIIIISKDKQIYVAKQSDIVLFLWLLSMAILLNGYSFLITVLFVKQKTFSMKKSTFLLSPIFAIVNITAF